MPKLARVGPRKNALKPGKVYPLNMRTTADVRASLVDAASKSGRSLAQEVEHRLKESFSREKKLAELIELEFSSAEAAAIFRDLASVAKAVEAKAGKGPWYSDFLTFQAVRAAWEKMTLAWMPPPPQELKEALAAPTSGDAVNERIAAMNAELAILDAAGAQTVHELMYRRKLIETLRGQKGEG